MEVPPAAPITTRAGLRQRMRTMGRVGLAIMFHDRLKFLGTLLGVIFAVILSNQALGTLLGIVNKNALVIRNAGADLWVVPPGTESLGTGKVLPLAALTTARVTPGVAAAEPMIYAGGTIAMPNGGREPVTIVGIPAPYELGGPWNLVAGERDVLRRPDTMIFEDSERGTLGGLNLGSVREVNGHRVVVGGFTWGLTPVASSFAFADYDLAREVARVPRDQTTYVLVKLAAGADAADVSRRLAERLPGTLVLTRDEIDGLSTRYLLTKSPIGIVFGASTVFGLIIGFVIVSLSMFSAVVDNLREYGTLKAVGATNGDLTLLLLVQSLAFAGFGSLFGLAAVSQIVRMVSSAKLTILTPPWLSLATLGLMTVMCIGGSMLALMRLRKLEPGMVFR